ncbi:MAG: hypothetical protein VW338_13885, partial [Rhodospirillaceae bacterium]
MAAPTHVQNAQNSSTSASSTLGITFASDTTTGNLIVVIIRWFNGTTTVDSVTDSQGNTYVSTSVGKQYNSSAQHSQQIFYAKNITGGTTPTVTVTFSGSTERRAVSIFEVQDADTTAPEEVTTSGNGTSASHVGGNLTPAGAAILFAVDMQEWGYGSVTVPTSWTDYTTSTIWYIHKIGYREVSTGGTYDTTFTGANVAYYTQGVAFKEAAGGSVETGAGASAGVATATAVGASTFTGAGVATASATAAGVGASTASADGASDGAATVGGVGSGILTGAGS